MNKLFIVLATILAVSIAFPISMVPHPGDLKESTPPTFSIDLNVEPRHRWDHIVPTFKVAIQRFIHNVIDLVNFPESLYVTFGTFAELQPEYYEFVEELKGIGEIADVDWRKLLLSNFIYDISSILPHPKLCSSIVAKNKDGKVIHGRNLDFWPWGLFSKDSAIIKVYRGDEYVAEFEQLVGAVMVLSGIRPDGFSVTVDTRKYNDHTLADLIDNILVKKYMPSTFLTRNVLQEKNTYEEARDALKNTNTTAPIYYVVGGIDKGCIIEKEPEGYHGFYEIGPDSDDWYLVQTNYDRWEDPGQDDRKTPAEKRLTSIGQDRIDVDNMFTEIMKKYPTLNIASIYTSMFIPSSSYSSLTSWYGNIDDLPVRGNLRNEVVDEDTYISDPWVRELNQNEWKFSQEEIEQATNYMIDIVAHEITIY